MKEPGVKNIGTEFRAEKTIQDKQESLWILCAERARRQGRLEWWEPRQRHGRPRHQRSGNCGLHERRAQRSLAMEGRVLALVVVVELGLNWRAVWACGAGVGRCIASCRVRA
jgi:hypothetical protein